MRINTEVKRETRDTQIAGILTRWVVTINGQGLTFTAREPTRKDVDTLVNLWEKEKRQPKLSERQA